MTNTTARNRTDDNQLSLFDDDEAEDTAIEDKAPGGGKRGASGRDEKAASHAPSTEPGLPEAVERGGREEQEGSANGARSAGGPGSAEPASAPAAQTATETASETATDELSRAYDRYVEIIDDTYDSAFSAAKRNAAFKEAAREHGVRVADLKRYSTAAALGIPYERVAIRSEEPVQDRRDDDER